MSDEEIIDVKGSMDKILLAVRFLAEQPIEELLTNLGRVDAIMPFVDPTAYRDALYNGNLDWQRKVLRAVQPIPALVRELEELVATKLAES